MPTLEKIPLVVGGVAEPRAMLSQIAALGLIRDSDRVRVVDECYAPMGGYNRVGEPLYKGAIHPATQVDQHNYSRTQIAIMAFSENYDRKDVGMGLAAVDPTNGRVLGIGHQFRGIKGTQLISQLRMTNGTTGLTLTTSGIFTGTLSTANPGNYIVEITLTNKFKWSKDGGTSYTTNVTFTGSAQALADGVYIQGASTGHTVGRIYRFQVGGRPCIAATMQRRTDVTFVSFVSSDDVTLISHPFSEVLVADGRKLTSTSGVRRAGIAAPHIKPTVVADTTEGTDIGSDETNPTNWKTVQAGVVVSRQTTVPTPQVGTAYIDMAIPKGLHGGNFDIACLNSAITIAADCKSIKVWLYFDHSEGRLKRGRLSFVAGTAAGLGGTRKVIPIIQDITYGRWTEVEIPWDNSGAAFSAASIGWRLSGGIKTEAAFSILFDSLRTDAGVAGTSTAKTSTLFATSREAYFRFCWVNRTTKQISAPSPWTEPIALNGVGVRLDLSGYYPSIQAGLKNSAPTGVDAVKVFVAFADQGKDPRVGGLDFHQISDDDGETLTELQSEFTLQSAVLTGAGNGTLTQQVVIDTSAMAASETITVDFSDATNFTVTGSVSGAHAAGVISTLADGTTGVNYKDKVAFKITVGGTPFGATSLFTMAYVVNPFTNGELILKLGDEYSDRLLNSIQNPRVPFFNSPPLAGVAVFPMGNRAVTVGLRPYICNWVVAANSHLIYPADGGVVDETGVIGQWMEGRQIRFDGDMRKWTILKALDTNADGILDRLYIGLDWDPKRQELTKPYDGSTSSSIRGEIVGDPRGIYPTNNTGEFGVDPESASILSRIAVLPHGDEIRGGLLAGGNLWVMGSDSIGIVQENTRALDDLPIATGIPFSDPQHISGIGLMGERAWYPRSDGQSAFFISSRGELYIASGFTATRLPVSDRLAAILGGAGLLNDTSRASKVFIRAFKDAIGKEHVWIGMLSGNPESAIVEDATNSGDAVLSDVSIPPGGYDETITITATEDGPAGDITISGSVSGSLTAGVSGGNYSNARIRFRLAETVGIDNGDRWKVRTKLYKRPEEPGVLSKVKDAYRSDADGIPFEQSESNCFVEGLVQAEPTEGGDDDEF